MKVLDELADRIDADCGEGLNLFLIDGLPASGKSTLTQGLASRLIARGRPAVTVENDWFIGRSIRNPVSILLGVATALSPVGMARVERRLLKAFLDGGRLGRFQSELQAAARTLEDEDSVTVWPDGAFWNLRRPPPWRSASASKGLSLQRRGVVLVEGTLTAAAWCERFPDAPGVFVDVPAHVARARFLERDFDPLRERNRAFSALAKNELAFRLAARLLARRADHYAYALDLSDFGAPRLNTRELDRERAMA